MPSMASMAWQNWTQKPAAKGYNFIPQMQSKFVERAFLVGGFVGSKSQAGSSPSRAQISLNDVIIEQLLLHGLNLYNDIRAKSCIPVNKVINSSVQNLPNRNNWRTNNIYNNKKVENNTNFYSKCSQKGYVNNKSSVQVPLSTPTTKHSQQSKEELVYEDKDEGGNSIYVYQEVQKSTCEVTKTSLFHVRSRTISDCSIESDDSFIIFESNEDNDEDEDDDVLENFEYEDSSSDESNECEEVDYLASPLGHSLVDTPSRILKANKKWNKIDEQETCKTPKKVTFANGQKLAQVRTIFTWDFAHRAARKGPWEMYALDRSRFKSKIQQLSSIISPILVQDHRKRIFQQRFAINDT